MGLYKIFLIVIGFNLPIDLLLAEFKWPMLHCATEVEMVGNSEKVYSNALDSFVGENFFECFNYKENSIFESEDSFSFKLLGPLTTGFNNSDILKLKITQFLSTREMKTQEGTYHLQIYSEVPHNDKVSFYIVATSLNVSGQLLLSLYTPISLANDLRSFVEQQTKLIIKKASRVRSGKK